MSTSRIATRCAMVAALVAPGGLVSAQGTRVSTAKIVAGRPLTGACASLSSAPSDLVRSPEGMAVLRLKRELDGAAMVFVQKGAGVEGMDAHHVAEMQRGVDSLVNVIVRTRGTDGATERSITVRRGDSTVVLNGKPLDGRTLFESTDGSMKNIEVFVRAMEPRVKEFAAASARASNQASTTGYLGLNMSGSQIRIVNDSGSFTAHCDYPVVEAVDVGSPARKAGIEAGDTIIAYNGRDITAQTVNYPQLLVPGKVVRIKVRHDGKGREIPVTVEARPRDMTEGFISGAMRPGLPRLPSPDGPMAGNMMFRVTPSAGMATANMSMGLVLGAQLNAMDDDFAQSLGVEPGLLVLRVQTGTPAAEAGLKAGEIVRAVNGTAVRELALLRRAISAPGVHEVKLTVSARESAPRVVIVRF